MWNSSDAVYNDEYKKALTKLMLGFDTPAEYEMVEIFGSIMPPRIKGKSTYAVLDKGTQKKHIEELAKINETYSPLYLKKVKEIAENPHN